MSTLVMLKAMMKKHALETVHYPFNTMLILGSVYAMFMVVFMGASTIMGGSEKFGQTTAGLVVAVMLFMLVMRATADLAFLLMIEARDGTLEQLSMSPLGFGRVMIARSVAAITFHLLEMFVLLLLMMATTGRWLHVDLVSVVPLVLLAIAGPVGIGFFMGGLALVYKQTTAAFQMLNFVYLALISAPLDRYPIAKWMPLAWGSELVSRVMVHGESLFTIGAGDLAFLVANSAFYFGLGFAGFKFFERTARERGLLGHY